MAEGIRFVCKSCGAEIEAWDDGNPYYRDEAGRKKYAYHPDYEGLARCIGNDEPHLCLACGEQFMMDSEAPTDRCPGCGSTDIADTFRLEGRRCPSCKKGEFVVDPSFHCIS